MSAAPPRPPARPAEPARPTEPARRPETARGLEPAPPAPAPRPTVRAPGETRGPLLGRDARRWWLVAHLVAQCWYLAGVVGALALMLLTTGADPADRVAAHHFARLLDWVLVIPGTHLVLLTGLVLALGTRYTLTGQRWIVAKLVANVGLITAGGIVVRRWAHSRAVADARLTGDGSIVSTDAYAEDARGFLLALAISLVVLVAIIAVSVIKPWGRTGRTGPLVVAATLGWLVGVDASFGVARGANAAAWQLILALAGAALGVIAATVLRARRTAAVR